MTGPQPSQGPRSAEGGKRGSSSPGSSEQQGTGDTAGAASQLGALRRGSGQDVEKLWGVKAVSAAGAAAWAPGLTRGLPGPQRGWGRRCLEARWGHWSTLWHPVRSFHFGVPRGQHGSPTTHHAGGLVLRVASAAPPGVCPAPVGPHPASRGELEPPCPRRGTGRMALLGGTVRVPRTHSQGAGLGARSPGLARCEALC